MKVMLLPRMVSTLVIVAIFIQMTICISSVVVPETNARMNVLELSSPPLPLLGGNQTIDPRAGTLTIVAGNGSFSTISSSQKTLSVFAGTKISGTITLRLNNTLNSSTTAPLVYAASWGGHEPGYRTLIPWVTIGLGDVSSGELQVTAPSTPGTYYLLFTFSAGLNGAQVASGTDQGYGAAVWNDGNDLADMNSSQVAQAQDQGRTYANILTANGYREKVVPSDAIMIKVIPAGTSLQLLEIPVILALLIAISGMFLFIRKRGGKRAQRLLDSSYLVLVRVPDFAREEIVHDLDESKDLLERKRYGRSERNTRKTLKEIDELMRVVGLVRAEIESAEKMIEMAKHQGLSIDASAIGLKDVQTQLGGK